MRTTILCAAAAILGAFGAWQYQGHKYGQIIAERDAAQSNAIALANAKAKENGDQNAKIMQQLALAENERNAALQKSSAASSELVRTRGLYVRAICPGMPNAATATGQLADGSAYAKLSDDTSQLLNGQAVDADKVAAYAWTAHEYAVVLDKWIDDHEK